MEIKKIHQDFSVCKVMDYSLVKIDAEYSFIGKTDEEKSLVCITSDVPPNVIQRDDGWKGFRIQVILDFSDLENAICKKANFPLKDCLLSVIKMV